MLYNSVYGGNVFETPYDDDDDDDSFLDDDDFDTGEENEAWNFQDSEILGKLMAQIQQKDAPQMRLVPHEQLEEARNNFWKRQWVLDESDQVREDDILGLRSVKRVIKEIISLVQNWEEYQKIPGIKLPRGGLLYGQPGNGKTMCVRWIITEMQGECFNVRDFPLVSEKDSRWTDKDVGALYSGARKRFGETGKPVILVWDEMDAYVKKDKTIQGKDVVASSLCTEMDGIEGQNAPVFLIGTANYTGGFEQALTRAGRLSLSAECVQLNAEDAKKMLLMELDKMGMPHPSEEHIEDLLGDGDRSAIDIKEAVARAKMRAVVSEGILTEKSIGRALLEQMIPIPSDNAYDKEYLTGVAWHEVGHALFAHALGLRLQRIDVHRVANQQGSIVLSQKAIESQIDGFCYIITAMGGRLMENHRLGKSRASLFAAQEDYRSIVNNFTISCIQGGGFDGLQFDWKALNDRIDFTADTRAEHIDEKAQYFMTMAGDVGLSIFTALEEGAQINIKSRLEPLVNRLLEEGIILGSDAFGVIEKLLNRPLGWYRERATEAWQEIS